MTTPDNLVPNFYTEHGTLVKCPPEGGKTDGNDLRHAAQAAKDMTLEDLMEHTEHGPVSRVICGTCVNSTLTTTTKQACRP